MSLKKTNILSGETNTSTTNNDHLMILLLECLYIRICLIRCEISPKHHTKHHIYPLSSTYLCKIYAYEPQHI